MLYINDKYLNQLLKMNLHPVTIESAKYLIRFMQTQIEEYDEHLLYYTTRKKVVIARINELNDDIRKIESAKNNDCKMSQPDIEHVEYN